MNCDNDAIEIVRSMRFGLFCDQEEDDMDYKSEDSVSDNTDSDIDINEDDQLKSDVEDDGEGKQKKKLTSKAYKVGFSNCSKPVLSLCGVVFVWSQFNEVFC